MTKKSKETNSANLGFEEKIWLAADKLSSNMDAAEYKHVVLGLIFLKYISDAFNEIYEEIKERFRIICDLPNVIQWIINPMPIDDAA